MAMNRDKRLEQSKGLFLAELSGGMLSVSLALDELQKRRDYNASELKVILPVEINRELDELAERLGRLQLNVANLAAITLEKVVSE